jgi:Gpi18-like mannosyltransferase
MNVSTSRQTHWFLQVIFIFFASRLALLLVGIAAVNIFGCSVNNWQNNFHLLPPGKSAIDIWSRWDSEWILSVVLHGYQTFPITVGTTTITLGNWGFFPLYPMLVRLINTVTGNPVAAGIVVSNFSAIGALSYVYLLARDLRDEDHAVRTVTYLCLFPTTLFLSAVYTESLFLLTTVAAIFYATRKKWLIAVLWGMLSTLVRPPGILLLLPLFLLYMEQRDNDWRKIDFRVSLLLVVPLGMIFYMIYLYYLTGNPLVFMQQQTAWGRSLSAPWTPFWGFIKNPALHSYKFSFIDFFLACLVVGAIPSIFRRFSPAHGSYALVSILVPLTTGILASIGRYSLVIYPLFFILSDWGKRSYVHSIIVLFFGPLSAIMMVLFATWRWAN